MAWACEDHRMPRKMFFASFRKPRPRGKPKMRWSDRVIQDMKLFALNPGNLLELTNDRTSWSKNIREATQRMVNQRHTDPKEGPLRSGASVQHQHTRRLGTVCKDNGDKVRILWIGEHAPSWEFPAVLNFSPSFAVKARP